MTPSLDAVFAALSDPTRRAVIERLRKGPAKVGELAAPHAMALPSFMAHLRKLEDAGLIVSVKQGRVRICRMAPGAFQAANHWLMVQHENRPGRLDRLDSFMDRFRNDA